MSETDKKLKSRLLQGQRFLKDMFPNQYVEIWNLVASLEDIEDKVQTVEDELRRLTMAAQEAIKWKEGGPPVSFTDFATRDDLLGDQEPLWPVVMEAAEEINSGEYVEAVMTGGIGAAKTTLAIYTLAYQIYVLSRYRNPQAEFGIKNTDEIVFIMQSITGTQAREVGYDRLRSLIAQSPYFAREFPFAKERLTEMIFPQRIKVVPVTSSVTAAIGQNVIGGLLDELNFMSIVENSKVNKDGTTFDQAQELYLSIKRRRESRFMVQGFVPGMLCLVSSKRYPGEFTERKANEAKEQILKTGKTRIYVYDKRVWEVKPEGSFTKGRFNVFIGDQTRKPRIMAPDEKPDKQDLDSNLILPVPTEYKHDFEIDLLTALRDIGGVSTLAMNPFIIDIEKIYACFGKAPSVVDNQMADFETNKIKVLPKKFLNLKQPRFVHLDLSITGDSTGVACGYVRKFEKVVRTANEIELLPQFVFDFILEVRPPLGGEIIFTKIRDLIYRCTDLGLPIKWVTMDSFQSTDTRQVLAQRGYDTGVKSVDTDNTPYDILKSALMDGRVMAPTHEKAASELSRLENDLKKQRIDHPPDGSKDCSDAMAGVAYGLFMQREIWNMHGISAREIQRASQSVVSTRR